VINEEDEVDDEPDYSRDSVSSSITSPINRMTIRSPLSSNSIPTPKSSATSAMPMSSSFLANRINIINNKAAAAAAATAPGSSQQQQPLNSPTTTGSQVNANNSQTNNNHNNNNNNSYSTSANSQLNGSFLMTPTPTSSHMSDMTTPQNSLINKFSSRTQMKLQLMKQQTEQFEKKSTTFASPPNTTMLLSTTPQQQQQLLSSATTTSSVVPPNTQPTTPFSNHHLDNPNVLEDLNASLIEDLRKRSNSICSNHGGVADGASSSSSANQLSLSPQIIPRDIATQYFQVETKLDNPTTFHVMQMLQQQTTNNNSDSNGKGRRGSLSSTSNKVPRVSTTTTPTTMTALSSSASPASILRNSQQHHQLRANSVSIATTNNNNTASARTPANSAASNISSALVAAGSSSSGIEVIPSSLSNTDFIINDLLKDNMYTPSNVSSVTEDSSFSHNELDELDDFVSDRLNGYLKQSTSATDLDIKNIKNETLEIEQYLNMPSTLPTDGYLKMAPGSPVRPSTSCPADIARLKKMHGVQLSNDEIRLIIKDRQKKDSHNMIERRRRFNINDRIKELGTLLPKQCQA
jgi:hypothetical protein